jgi:hypothetical protein
MSGVPSPSSPGGRRIGARVQVSHLVQSGRREELAGVVVGRRQYGVNVRLPDGTIRSFSDVEVSDEAGVAAAELRVDRRG